MDGERSNSDVMTLGQAGSRRKAKLPWTTGLIEELPTDGPQYRIEGSGDMGTYLYNQIFHDGAVIFYHDTPNKFMVPLNEEAKAEVHRYQLWRKGQDLRRQEGEEIARTPGIVSERAKSLGAQAAKIEAELAAAPKRPPKKKPVPKPRNNEV